MAEAVMCIRLLALLIAFAMPAASASAQTLDSPFVPTRIAHAQKTKGSGIAAEPLALSMVGPGRLELPTNGLRVRCSTN